MKSQAISHYVEIRSAKPMNYGNNTRLGINADRYAEPKWQLAVSIKENRSASDSVRQLGQFARLSVSVLLESDQSTKTLNTVVWSVFADPRLNGSSVDVKNYNEIILSSAWKLQKILFEIFKVLKSVYRSTYVCN